MSGLTACCMCVFADFYHFLGKGYSRPHVWLVVFVTGNRTRTGKWVILFTHLLIEGGWKSALLMLKVMTKLLSGIKH